MRRFVRILLAAAVAVTVPVATGSTLATGEMGSRVVRAACCCGAACACTAANSCGCVVRAPDSEHPRAALPAATATHVSATRAAGSCAAPWSVSLPADNPQIAIALHRTAASGRDSSLRHVVVLQV